MSGAALWSQMCGAHHAAGIDRYILRHPSADPAARDDATVRYARQLDHIMDLLDKMAEQQLLAQIGSVLSGRARG